MQKSYPYIHIVENQVVVYVPISSGERFGVDNTCKISKAFDQFLLGEDITIKRADGTEKKIHLPSVIESLKSLKKDLGHLLKEASNEKDEENINKMIDQAQKYIEVINESWKKGVFDKEDEEDEDVIKFKLPKFFTKLATKDNSNLVSVHFSVFMDDRNLGAPVDNGAYFLEFPQDFVRSMVQGETENNTQNRLKLNIPLTKENLLSKFDDGTVAWNTANFQYIKNQIIKFLKESGATDESINAVQAVAKDVIGVAMLYEENDAISKKDIAENIVNSFIDIKLFRKEDDTFVEILSASDSEKIWVSFQMFLACIEMAHYEKNGTKLGVLDESKLYILTTVFLDAIESGKNIEDALLSYFEGNLTEDLKPIIKNKFKHSWGTLKESPHFDEFVFLLEKEGPFVCHQNYISVPFSKVLQEINGDLHKKYFTNTLKTKNVIQNSTSSATKELKQSDVDELITNAKKLYQKGTKNAQLKLFLQQLAVNQRHAIFNALKSNTSPHETQKADFFELSICRIISDMEPENYQIADNGDSYWIYREELIENFKSALTPTLDHLKSEILPDVVRMKAEIVQKIGRGGVIILNEILKDDNSDIESKVKKIHDLEQIKNTIPKSEIEKLVENQNAILNVKIEKVLDDFKIGDPIIATYPSVKNNLRFESYLGFLQHKYGAVKVFTEFEKTLDADGKKIKNLVNDFDFNVAANLYLGRHILQLQKLHNLIVSIQSSYIDPNTKSLYYIDDAGANLIRNATETLQSLTGRWCCEDETPELKDIRQRFTKFLVHTCVFATHEKYQKAEQNIINCKLSDVTGVKGGSLVDVPHNVIINDLVRPKKVDSPYNDLLLNSVRKRDFSVPKAGKLNGDIVEYKEIPDKTNLTQYVQKQYLNVRSQIKKLKEKVGTTANIVASDGNDLSILNLGDTRSILMLQLTDGTFVSIDLTDIHTPLHHRKADITKLEYQEGGQLRFKDTGTNT